MKNSTLTGSAQNSEDRTALNPDEAWMKRALELAKQGWPLTSPNPMVGAVIVKDGRLIGEGWHQKAGGLHAEREALKNCSESAKGADLYVTLEPCCHTGKQPPCTEAILEAGIKRVFVGSLDPNPLVSGKGIQILRDHGIEVASGILEEECCQLNRHFFHYITRKKPWVTMKFAMTLDGKTALETGESKWITSEEARRHVHQTRHENMAIMAGIGTVLADDPMLDCRIENGRNPLRVICDTHLRTPMNSKLVQSAREIPVILAAGKSAAGHMESYLQAGCQVWLFDELDGKVDLDQLMNRLAENHIDTVLLEGGSTLNQAMLKAGLVSHIQAYIAPKIFGGHGPSPVGGMEVRAVDEALRLGSLSFHQIGPDILIEGDLISETEDW